MSKAAVEAGFRSISQASTETSGVEEPAGFEHIIRDDSKGNGGADDLESVLCRDAELVDLPHEAETFWIAEEAQPKTNLERLAKSIFDFHEANLRGSHAITTAPSPPDAETCSDIQNVHPVVGAKRSRDGAISKRLDDDGSFAGAEWWIQIRKEGFHSDMGMPFHWDKDERLMEERGALRYPTVSTVTYLTNYGAPTVVLKARASRQGPVFGVPLDKAFVSYPSRFKHLAFDGSLLHGVPEVLARRGTDVLHNERAEHERRACYPRNPGPTMTVTSSSHYRPILTRGSEACDAAGLRAKPAASLSSQGSQWPQLRKNLRVTLLVNVWLSHKPVGIDPLPETIAAGLSRGLDLHTLNFGHRLEFARVTIPPTIKDSAGSDCRHCSGEDGGESKTGVAASTVVEFKAALGPTTVLEMCLPSSGTLSTGGRRDVHAFLICFSDECQARIIPSNASG